MPAFRILGNHGVASAVQEWLNGLELPLPRELTLDLVVDDVVQPGQEPIFRQPEISIYRDGGSGTLSVSWDHLPAVAHVPLDSSRATVQLSRAASEDLPRCFRFFLSAVLIFVVRRVGWHHLHAATWIDPRGRGWVFAGDWKVGKSTTTALLASRGWAVGGDDAVFLVEDGDGVETIAQRRAIALREGGRRLLGRLGGVFDSQRNKTLFTPEELGGQWVQRIRPDILVFPKVAGSATSVEPIGPSDVLTELVRWSAWVMLEPALAQEHLDLLAVLGGQTRNYRMNLGTDLFDNPDLLLELIP